MKVTVHYWMVMKDKENALQYYGFKRFSYILWKQFCLVTFMFGSFFSALFV